jgi:hypothetical protein
VDECKPLHDGCSADYPDYCALFLRLVTPATDVKVSYRFSLVGCGAGCGDGGEGGGGGGGESGGKGGGGDGGEGAGARAAACASGPVGPSGGGGYERAAHARRFNTQDMGAKASW